MVTSPTRAASVSWRGRTWWSRSKTNCLRRNGTSALNCPGKRRQSQELDALGDDGNKHQKQRSDELCGPEHLHPRTHSGLRPGRVVVFVSVAWKSCASFRLPADFFFCGAQTELHLESCHLSLLTGSTNRTGELALTAFKPQARGTLPLSPRTHSEDRPVPRQNLRRNNVTGIWEEMTALKRFTGRKSKLCHRS
jgi:hypothetical protein